MKTDAIFFSLLLIMTYLKEETIFKKLQLTGSLFQIFTICCASWQHQSTITVTERINNFIQMSIYRMFSLLINLSKFISKLSENCTLVSRNINVLIWTNIHACDFPLWKLTAMQRLSIDFFRKWQRGLKRGLRKPLPKP